MAKVHMLSKIVAPVAVRSRRDGLTAAAVHRAVGLHDRPGSAAMDHQWTGDGPAMGGSPTQIWAGPASPIHGASAMRCAAAGQSTGGPSRTRVWSNSLVHRVVHVFRSKGLLHSS